MFTAPNPGSVLIKIETDSQSFFTKVYSGNETLRSERFNTEAAAWMALEFFRKEYNLEA